CTVEHIIQPDYSELPASTPQDVIIHWDGSGSSVQLEFYKLASAITWIPPLPNGTLFQAIADSQVGFTHIDLATFADLRAGNLGIMASNPGAASDMDTQNWS